MQITLYTDGACDIHADNQPGGWAAILCATDERGAVLKESVISGGQEMTTNNQMELAAVIAGLKQLQRPSDVTVVSDSRYVIDIANKVKRSKKNEVLWKEYFALAVKHQVNWVYVEGHSGHPYNERCDRIAVAEKNKFARARPDELADMVADSDIRVYLSSRFDGKRKRASWAAVIATADAVDEAADVLENKTELETVLIAAITCLRELPKDLCVTIFTAQEYLAKGMNNWIKNWMAKGWKTREGKPVKYERHWRELAQLTGTRKVNFVFVKARADDPHFQRGKALSAQRLEGVK